MQQAKGHVNMKSATADATRDFFGILLGALGLQWMPVNQFAAGILLSIAGASLARHYMPERDNRELWVIMATAVIVGVFSAVFAHIFAPSLPVSLVMFLGGALSRAVMRLIFGVGRAVEKRSDEIGERVIDRVLPGAAPAPAADTFPPAPNEENNQ